MRYFKYKHASCYVEYNLLLWFDDIASHFRATLITIIDLYVLRVVNI